MVGEQSINMRTRTQLNEGFKVETAEGNGHGTRQSEDKGLYSLTHEFERWGLLQPAIWSEKRTW